jgi:hypothetical protein
MAVFWFAAPCSLVDVYLCFRGACRLHHQGDDACSKHIWNADKFLPDCMAQQRGKRPSSYSPPWELDLTLGLFILAERLPTKTGQSAIRKRAPTSLNHLMNGWRMPNITCGLQLIIVLPGCNTNVEFYCLHSQNLKIELSQHSLSSWKPPGPNSTLSVDIMNAGAKCSLN